MPSAIACAMPKRGSLRAHSGRKCESRQICAGGGGGEPGVRAAARARAQQRQQQQRWRRGARLAAAVHLLGLAVELRQRELGRHARVAHGNVELQVELVLDRVVEGPHLALPPRAGLVRRLDRKPLVARLLVDLLVLRAAAAAAAREHGRRRARVTGGRTWMSALYSSFTRLIQSSPSRGPALMVHSGSLDIVAFVASSMPAMVTVGGLRLVVEGFLRLSVDVWSTQAEVSVNLWSTQTQFSRLGASAISAQRGARCRRRAPTRCAGRRRRRRGFSSRSAGGAVAVVASAR